MSNYKQISMSPPRKDPFANVFEAVQAVVTLTFVCFSTLLVFISDKCSSACRLIFIVIMCSAIALISFFLTKKWKLSTVLWYLIISIFLAIGLFLMV